MESMRSERREYWLMPEGYLSCRINGDEVCRTNDEGTRLENLDEVWQTLQEISKRCEIKFPLTYIIENGYCVEVSLAGLIARVEKYMRPLLRSSLLTALKDPSLPSIDFTILASF